jgi:sugar lactone lactonase YvrE
MSAAKLKLALSVILVSAALSVGAGALAVHAWGDKFVQAKLESSPQAAAQKPVAPKQAEEPIIRTIRESDALPAGAIHRLGSSRFLHDHAPSWWMATAFAHNGKMLAMCAGSVRLWDPATGKLLREIDGRFWTTGSMLFSPDDKVLAVQAEKAIYLLDPATGKLLHRLAGEGLSRVFAFSPDGKLLATTGPSSNAKTDGNYSVSLLETATGRQIAVLRGHHYLIHSAAFTPDGRTLVTACYRNRICRWDVARGELRKSFNLQLPEGRVACLSPDGATLAIAPPRVDPKPGEGDTLWDTETGQQRSTLPSRRGVLRDVDDHNSDTPSFRSRTIILGDDFDAGQFAILGAGRQRAPAIDPPEALQSGQFVRTVIIYVSISVYHGERYYGGSTYGLD